MAPDSDAFSRSSKPKSQPPGCGCGRPQPERLCTTFRQLGQNGFDETSTRQPMKIQHFMALVVLSLATVPVARAATITWTGADPSGYWSAPANWSPAGAPVNGNDLVFPGGLPPGHMVSTNDVATSFFR